MNTKQLDLAQFEGHTPGPWRDRITTGGCDHAISSREGAVCVIPFKYGTTEQRNKNARAIIALPALLAECRRQREQIRVLREQVKTLRGRLGHYENVPPMQDSEAAQ